MHYHREHLVYGRFPQLQFTFQDRTAPGVFFTRPNFGGTSVKVSRLARERTTPKHSSMGLMGPSENLSLSGLRVTAKPTASGSAIVAIANIRLTGLARLALVVRQG